MSTSVRPGVRWAVPLGATALVLGGAVLGPVLTASAEVELPQRTPEQLLVDVQTADVDAFSGTVTQSAELGLPELPDGVGGEYSTDLLSLLAGEHTLKVWADGDKARVALHGTMGESDVRTDGTQVWTWSTEDRSVHHLALPDDGLPDDAGRADRDAALAEALPPVTPEQVAAFVLARLEPTTEVSAGPNTLVAGRPAYELVLEPRAEDATLVGSIRIAVDAGERVPTRVQVWADGAESPAVEVGFTALSFDAPDASNFAFTPPDDATVEEHALGELGGLGHGHDPATGPHTTDRAPGTAPDAPGAPDGPRRGAVVGTGWDAVVVTRAPGTLADVEGDLGVFLQTLPVVDGDWGSGRLLSSALFTALLTDDGRLLVGAVDDATLFEAAADPAADLG